MLKRKQAGRTLCLLAMLVFGCFSITTTCLLIRSEKKTEIDDALALCGDYDVIAYEAPLGFEDYCRDSKVIDDVGLYYELGSVSNSESTSFFKAVGLKDELSEEMYHLTCFRGSLPTTSNEIAIDISVANTFGVIPYPGETIILKNYNSSGEYIEEKEYKICGVFRMVNSDVYGGWNRAPYSVEVPMTYDAPTVFFCPYNLDKWGCTKETIFFRAYSTSASSLIEEISRIKDDSGQSWSGIEYNDRRNGVYSSYIGLNSENFYRHSLEDRFEAVDKGHFNKDFYSEIVFPIISILVIVIEAVSIYMLSTNIIADRKEQYSILRSIGMSSRKVIGTLLAEMLVICMIGTVVGISLGYATHLTLISLVNKIWHLQLYDGIHVERVIKQITYNPIIMSIVVSICSLLIALTIPIWRLHKMYPSELLRMSDGMFVRRKKLFKVKTSNLKENWLELLNKRIDLHDKSTMMVMIIVLSAALFGYVFFLAFSERATTHERSRKELMGLDGDVYVVTRSPELLNLGYNVFNRHDAGIIPSFPEQLENNPNVERVWSVIKNVSTRMVFSEEPNESVKQLLGNRSLNRRASDDLFRNEGYVAETSIFGHMGYDTSIFMYELPTVGLTLKEIDALSGEVISGSIDIERIRRGEEIVLAVPENLKDLCLHYYPVGSSLTFDDILLTEEEEKLDKQSCLEEKWIVYDNYIETDLDEYHVGYTSFGTRHSVNTKVGAIVILHDEKDISEYLSAGTEWVNQLHYDATSDSNDPEPTYGLSILCLPESFEAWELPDRNYTSVKAELKKNYNVYEFDEFWYMSLSGSVDVQTKSTFDYSDGITTSTNRVMFFFYAMLIVLIVLGVVSIISGLYTKTRSNSARFQTLRRIGLSVRQACLMIYVQNMFYPALATIIAIIPICVVQRILDFYEAKIASDQFDILAKQWYVRIPYGADLFSYDFIPALFCCMMLGLILIFLGTLPQILYLHKLKMIETREE